MRIPIITGWALLVLAACSGDSSPTVDDAVMRDGLHLVFLMGQDGHKSDYFALADEYYAGQSSIDHMVKHCRSLDEVIDYLNNLKGQTIDVVDLVAHGNKATGLSVSIAEGGHRATPKRLIQETILKRASRLAPEVVDTHTMINVWSCGVGGNPMTVLGIKQLFKPVSGPPPQVHISEDFVVYKRDKKGAVRRYAATYYPYQYRRGYKPSRSEIIADLKRQYPDGGIDWQAAIEDETAQLEYHLPVTFLQFFEDPKARPELTTTAQQLAYVQTQDDIAQQLEDLDMHYDDFHWQVDKRVVFDEKGQRSYAVKAIGMTTILCFLELKSDNGR